MGCLESTGGTWAWHLTALFFCLDLSFNSLLVQGIPANSDPSFNSILILYEFNLLINNYQINLIKYFCNWVSFIIVAATYIT
jgi:hypothetical protein